MADHDNYSETNEVQSHSDYIGIETKPIPRPPILEAQLDDLTVWAQRELYTINDMALLMASISPFRCGSIESAYQKGYSDYQLERAVVLREAMLDGLEVGSLTAFKIVCTAWNGEPHNVSQEQFIQQYSRHDVVIEQTAILKNVLFAWIAKKQYKSVKRDIQDYNATRGTQARILLPDEYSTPAIELLKDHVEQNLMGADDNYLSSRDGIKQQKQYLRVNGERMGLVNKEIDAIHTVARSPVATAKYTKNHAQGKTPKT